MSNLNNTGVTGIEEFLEFFLLDSQEQIERLGASILDLERDSENIGLINELFRSAHSLKGASGTMGFTAIVEVTHASEDLLDKVRQGKLAVTHEIIDVLLEVTDVVKAMLVQVEARQPVRHDAQELVERIRRLAKGGDNPGASSTSSVASASTAVQAVQENDEEELPERVRFNLDENALLELQDTLCGHIIYQITIALDEAAMMKTVRAVMVMQRLQELGKVLSVAPSLEEMETMEAEEKSFSNFSFLLASNEPEGEISLEVLQVSDVVDAQFLVFSSSEISQLCNEPADHLGVQGEEKGTKPKPKAKKDSKAKKVKEGSVLEEIDTKEKALQEQALEEKVLDAAKALSCAKNSSVAGGDGISGSGGSSGGTNDGSSGGGLNSGGASGGGASGGGGMGGSQIPEVSNQVHTIRVDTDRMDNLINMVGEMVITRARLVKIGDDLKSQFPSDHLVSNLNETNIYLGRLMNDLQESAMRLRMVPVGTVFSRYPRLVRDFCRKTGKKIDLELHGEETEMDKTVIEQIGDPLTHLIRNCVDHGIESPEVRVAAGKPEIGKIILKAYHEGNHIAIVISDDGSGLNLQRIRKKGVDSGLINESDELSEREIANLIFLPGFSTTDQVTDISGRGVGMDVVKRALTSLGGSIDIRTKPGEGTVFTIRLPLTLAIIQALLVDICGEIYAVPLSSIQETLLVHNTDVPTVGGIKMVKLRGNTLPLISLKNKFGLPENEEQEDVFVVVVGIAERLIGLMVDELKGQQEIVLKTLGEDLGLLTGISGATILGDGKVTLILDVASLMQDVVTY